MDTNGLSFTKKLPLRGLGVILIIETLRPKKCRKHDKRSVRKRPGNKLKPALRPRLCTIRNISSAVLHSTLKIVKSPLRNERWKLKMLKHYHTETSSQEVKHTDMQWRQRKQKPKGKHTLGRVKASLEGRWKAIVFLTFLALSSFKLFGAELHLLL